MSRTLFALFTLYVIKFKLFNHLLNACSEPVFGLRSSFYTPVVGCVQNEDRRPKTQIKSINEREEALKNDREKET